MSNQTLSPDGKFMWNGNEWIPAPPRGKDPCENCGLTNYNLVRKCFSHARLKSAQGCGKFGCDMCFRYHNMTNGYFCTDCYNSAENSMGIVLLIALPVSLAIIAIFNFYVYGTIYGPFL